MPFPGGGVGCIYCEASYVLAAAPDLHHHHQPPAASSAKALPPLEAPVPMPKQRKAPRAANAGVPLAAPQVMTGR